MDQVVASGEQVSAGLLTIALMDLGYDAISYCGWQVRVITDGNHGKARILKIENNRLEGDLAQGRIVVVTGFQGVTEKSEAISTLGRGGSDTSAVALAASLNADECLIYTDVDGVYTTDPRIEPEARRLNEITFEEMLEMSSLGSKVLQIRSVEFGGKYKVKTRVLSSLKDPKLSVQDELSCSTLITQEEDRNMEEALISGIACNRDEAKITIPRVPDTPGIAHKILGPIAEANIDVDMIIQNAGVDGLTDFSFTVPRSELTRATERLEKKVIDEIGAKTLHTDKNICKVSIIGIGMRSSVGVASKMFEVLSKEGINIKMISTSEIKISVVLEDKYMELAVRTLHAAFGLREA
tara:strand:+ start:1 stop:1059 length:1059 start_codon:yes stop_codon:yes gene_type:complete